jgi:type II secretory pathway pseudopilin PulG
MKSNRKTTRISSGFTLIETIIFVTVLAFLSVVIVNTLLSLTRSWAYIRTEQKLSYSAAGVLERIIREVRNARSIDIANSVFDANPGTLALNTVDASGNPTVLTFKMASSTLSLQQTGVASSPLVDQSVAVPTLVFRHITTKESEAVKIEMTLSDSYQNVSLSENFYTTASVRDEYAN